MSALARRWLAIAALLGALGVTLGAFGAHALPGFLADLGYDEEQRGRRLDIFETAVRYHLLHSLALALNALALDRLPHRLWRAAAWLLLLGVVVFSGLLYVLTMASEDWRWLGAIVPLGGLAMIAGWTMLAIGAWRQ